MPIVAVRQEYLHYSKHMFVFQEGGGIFMEQTLDKIWSELPPKDRDIAKEIADIKSGKIKEIRNYSVQKYAVPHIS